MKAITMTCLLALSTCAFAGDILTEIQGKWKVDMQATKATPEAIEALGGSSEMSKNTFERLIGVMVYTTYTFSKDRLTLNLKSPQVMSEEVKTINIIKNTDKELVVKAKESGETYYIYKQDKGFVMRQVEQGKQSHVPSIVLVR